MAIRTDFTAGEVLAAADLNDTFAEKIPYAYGTATPTTTVDGYVWFDENETPPAPKFWDGAAFETFGGGKILQVVRATDSTNRSTTSSSPVDASISVTITPQKSDSSILVIHQYSYEIASGGDNIQAASMITDNSNNSLSGAEYGTLGTFNITGTSSRIIRGYNTIIGYSTPATLSATTYKARFQIDGATTFTIVNGSRTGQLYAIEVSA
jgi:hypothetical protein